MKIAVMKDTVTKDTVTKYGVNEKCSFEKRNVAEIFVEKRGFTLPEVCVAFAVFLVGVTGLLGCWNFFNREVADERYRLERYYDVLSAMESLIAVRPVCADSFTFFELEPALTDEISAERHSLASLRRSVTVRLDRVPGMSHIAWAVVEQDGFSLKRLVRCLGGARDER